VVDHLHSRRPAILDGFFSFLRLPSISTDPSYRADIRRCANWLVAEMARIGFDNCRTIETDGHPVVYGDWLHAGPNRPTVLVYAHYDVQPVDPLELWETPPFDPTLRDGRLYARGVADDKAGVWGNLMVLESIFAVDGQLPVNVKLIFEGEEESGSPNMAPFVAAHRDLLAADVVYLCDGPFSAERPTMAYALRGIVGARVTVSGPDHDLHSGAFGGAVENPIHVVSEIIASFHDQAGRVTIPGFQDRVRALDKEELDQMAAQWVAAAPEWHQASGTKHTWGDSVASIPERVTALPTLDVNGIWGGYQGPGLKTIIPARAGFAATMRLVADQDPREIADLFRAHVLSFASPTAAVDVTIVATGWPATVDRNDPAIEAAQQGLEAVLGKRAQLIRGGGSVPIAGMFQHELGAPLVPAGIGPGDNVHAPNEYLELEPFFQALDVVAHFYYNLAAAGA
jgi:acetylornithine deacetylase/succinyl-diaminopimelate desuccinylase-like protein